MIINGIEEYSLGNSNEDRILSVVFKDRKSGKKEHLNRGCIVSDPDRIDSDLSHLFIGRMLIFTVPSSKKVSLPLQKQRLL